MSLGLSLNNPGNIKNSSDVFKGEVTPSANATFKTFEDIRYGYRAMFRILFTYIDNGFDTITDIINRWAPPGENPTNNYIDYVVSKTNLPPSVKLTMGSEAALKSIVAAMAQFEQGNFTPNPADINEAWKLATGILEFVKKKA